MYPLPIADTTRLRYRSMPWATFALMALNILVWYHIEVQLLLHAAPYDTPFGPVPSQQIAHLIYGGVPYAIHTRQGIGALSAITASFVHAPGYLFVLPFSWHLFGNMVFLYAFGRRLEDACGPVRFLLFYLLAALIAATASALIRNASPVDRLLPGIGASGAIAGVMGAFLLLFPGTRITTIPLIGFIPVPLRFRIPALFFLVWWLAQQIIPAFQTSRGEALYTTDFAAHLAGFFAGLFIFLFVRKDLLYRYLSGSRL